MKRPPLTPPHGRPPRPTRVGVFSGAHMPNKREILAVLAREELWALADQQGVVLCDQRDQLLRAGRHPALVLQIAVVKRQRIIVEIDQRDLTARRAHRRHDGGEQLFVQ